MYHQFVQFGVDRGEMSQNVSQLVQIKEILRIDVAAGHGY
jgi:hypothetical protein